MLGKPQEIDIKAIHMIPRVDAPDLAFSIKAGNSGAIGIFLHGQTLESPAIPFMTRAGPQCVMCRAGQDGFSVQSEY